MMEHLLLAATAVDCAAVLALGWLVVRGARERELASATQRETVERLRDELKHLLEEAELRARALERTLGAREESLRATIGDVERGSARAAARRAAAHPLVTPWTPADGDVEDDRAETAPDPAELRLRRELELSLGKGRLA